MKVSISPAQHVLETYLQESLSNPANYPNDYELQIDILYLLADKIAHRRALADEPLLRELAQIRPPDLHLPTVTKDILKGALHPLLERRLIRSYDSGYGYDQYELAHDFLVRSVLRSWHVIDRQRTEKLAILRQERAEVEERLTRLARLEGTANWTLKLLPPIVLAVLIWLIYLGLKQELPLWLGLSILWLIVCPSAVVAAMAVARRTRAGVLFGLLAIAACTAASDEDNTLAMLVRRKGETLARLLTRLDMAIAKAYNEDVFTDEINPPPTNSKRS